MESAETRRNFVMLGVEMLDLMKWMQASLSIAYVLSLPPFPPAPISRHQQLIHQLISIGENGMGRGEVDVPADQTTQSGLTKSKIRLASASLFTSSKLSTKTSRLPGPCLPASKIAAF